MADSWGELKVLVTGARGFLGSNVAARLVQLGAHLCAFARQEPAEKNGVRWFSGDLSEPATVRALVREARPDIVFHLSGQTQASPDRALVLSSFRNNLTSTVLLLNELVEAGCQRIVTTASLEEPGLWNAESVPTSPYGASKQSATAYALMFHALYELPVVIVRPYMTYGPRQRANKLIPSVTLSLLRGQSPTISSPDREVDWIYVDDVVEAIVAAGRAPGVVGSTVDLGSGVLVPVREISRELQDLVGGPATVRLSSSEKAVGAHGRRAETECARKLLGWQAKTSLRTGLEQTVAWYRARLADYGDIG